VLSLSVIGLTRAMLMVFDPPKTTSTMPGPVRRRIPLQFNPERISLFKSASWSRTAAKEAQGANPPEFLGSQPRSVSVDVFLDATYSLSNTVEQQVETLLDCCAPTPGSVQGKNASPPWVRFEWGLARTVSFYAHLTSITANYTLFSADGRAKRATCSLRLEEIGGSTLNQNPTSGSRETLALHRTQAGDSLASLAWQHYGDAGLWRLIAAANRIADPERLPVGTTLLIPSIDEVSAGEAQSWPPGVESGS
jgi:nucleoid-associated protein YgaU